MGTTEQAPQEEQEVTLEQQQEIERLQHGIAMLDAFSSEDTQQQVLDKFLDDTKPGTESRKKILEGKSYLGDKKKFGMAIHKAIKGYSLSRVRLQSIYEDAQFLGIPAQIKGKGIIVPDEDQKKILIEQHNESRALFVGKNNKLARDERRRTFEAQIRQLQGENQDVVELGGSIRLEDRAIILTRALNAMARRSMLSGLNVAAPDEQYNVPIINLYGDKTNLVDQRSAKKYRRLYDQVRQDFMLGSGFVELKYTGIVEEHLLMLKANKMWNEFYGQYSHATQHDTLDEFRTFLIDTYIPEERLGETAFE